MNRILIVARAEFLALVRSKAFLISIALVPLLSMGMGTLQSYSSTHDTRPKRFAVIDPDGKLYQTLRQRSEARNAHLGGDKAPFLIERAVATGPLDDLRLRLSERVRTEELFAFVELPPDPLAAPWRYHSENVTSSELREFIGAALTDQLRGEEYQRAGLSPELVARLERPVTAERLGLFSRAPDGSIGQAARPDPIKQLVVPIVLPVLLFFFVMVSTPQMMNAVLVEKMSRVSEVLLGSVTTFQLMMGKLLGSVAVSMLLGVAYVGCGLGIAQRMGYGGAVSPAMIATFFFFLALAMVLYGSICLAVGASCTDLKDAQNLMLPVMLPLMIPLMMLSSVMESPSSPLAVSLSMFPLATPILMLLRLGLHPSPPVWQVALSVLATLATAIVCVFAAGRVFRIGLLSQGKTAGFRQMFRWMLTR